MSEVEGFLNNPQLKRIGSTEGDPILGGGAHTRFGEPRHPDFEKIYRQFMRRYCGSADEECERGRRAYYAWLNAHDLDDTKPYRRPQESEAFKWAEPFIHLAREDEENKYYKVEALFPLSSMNHNVYSEDELLRAARTLIGKPVNMNHELPLDGVEIVDAEFEDGAVEVLLKVPRDAEFEGKKIVDMIDNGEVLHVSIEGACRTRKPMIMDDEVGYGCEGLVLTGLALLQKGVLPGVPLTRIEPVEKIVSDFHDDRDMTDENLREEDVTDADDAEEAEEAEWDTAFINRLPDAAFAVIEPAYQRGETKDKRCRHLPHHVPSVRNPNEHESVDPPHLRNALARVNQIKPVTDSITAEELRRRAEEHLQRHAEALLPTYQEKEKPDEERKPKSPCESAKESLLKRLQCIEAEIPQMLTIIPRVLLLEDRVKRLEGLFEEPASKEEAEKPKEDAEQPEETLRILTRDGFWERFRELRREGLSKSDAYRLTAIEVLETLAKLRRDEAEEAR